MVKQEGSNIKAHRGGSNIMAQNEGSNIMLQNETFQNQNPSAFYYQNQMPVPIVQGL